MSICWRSLTERPGASSWAFATPAFASGTAMRMKSIKAKSAWATAKPSSASVAFGEGLFPSVVLGQGHAVSVFAAGGTTEGIADEHRARANPWANKLTEFMDADFFEDKDEPHHVYMGAIVESDPVIVAYASHPRLVGMAEELMGSEARIVEVNAHINRRDPNADLLAPATFGFPGTRATSYMRFLLSLFPSWSNALLSRVRCNSLWCLLILSDAPVGDSLRPGKPVRGERGKVRTATGRTNSAPSTPNAPGWLGRNRPRRPDRRAHPWSVGLVGELAVHVDLQPGPGIPRLARFQICFKNLPAN